MSPFTRGISLMVVLVLMVGSCLAQIPNAGFESWANGDPVGWSTNNGLYTFVTQTSPAHGGSSAAQGAVVSMGVINMSPTLVSEDNNHNGFPILQRYATVHGFYKFSPVGGDLFSANYLAELGTSGVGGGGYADTSAQSVYREFVIDVIYPGPDVPDRGTISFAITGLGGLPHIGSSFIVDDLSFGPTSGVNDPASEHPKAFKVGQNYPNPFNPTTSILYEVPVQSHVTMAVFDIVGREVAVLVDQVQSAGKYKAVFDASGLSSGVYFYRLAAGSFVQTNRMLLLR